MKITEENLEFPCDLKEKILKMINTSKIKVEFVFGKNIIFENTNLAITKPNLIIFSNDKYFIKVLNYGTDELFIGDYSRPVALTTLINLINKSINIP